MKMPEIFLDNVGGAASSEVRCNQRAMDYHFLCSNKASSVTVSTFRGPPGGAEYVTDPANLEPLTACFIAMLQCSRYPNKMPVFFGDPLVDSMLSEERCLDRAIEYHHW